MILNWDVPVDITLWVAIFVIWFIFRISWNISNFKSKVEDRCTAIEKDVCRQEQEIKRNTENNQTLLIAFGKIETRLWNIEGLLQKIEEKWGK